MITRIASGIRGLDLKGRWDTEERAPYSGARTILLRGSIVGSGPNARAMLRTARAELMDAVDLCSHSGGQVELWTGYGDTEIMMPARYLGMKQQGDRGMAQAGCTVELEFRCMAPYWKGSTVSATASLASGTCGLLMTNTGTAPARPAVVVRSTATYDGAVTLTLDDGRSVKWDGYITSNSGLAFDMAARQAYKHTGPLGGFPACANATYLQTANVTDYDEWLSTAWEMEDDEQVTVTADPAAAGLTAELIHVNEYY